MLSCGKSIDKHSEAMEVLRELRIGQDIDTFEDGSCDGISTDTSASRQDSMYQAQW
jgi:hypothetical protein